MRIDSTDKKKKKKRDQSIIEQELMGLVYVSLKSCIDTAMKDIFKDFNQNFGGTLHL